MHCQSPKYWLVLQQSFGEESKMTRPLHLSPGESHCLLSAARLPVEPESLDSPPQLRAASLVPWLPEVPPPTAEYWVGQDERAAARPPSYHRPRPSNRRKVSVEPGIGINRCEPTPDQILTKLGRFGWFAARWFCLGAVLLME